MTSVQHDGPIWAAIADALRDEIAGGAREPGDRMPTEAQLAQRFGVNRHTVRRALAALGDEGLLHSRRGAGVFVAARPADYPLGTRVRFHRNLAAAGRLPERRIRAQETRPARAAEAAALGLEAGAPLHMTQGVSLADGRPIALFTSYFPAQLLPNLPEALRATNSVTEAFKACGIPDYLRVSTRLSAVNADAAQAALLEVSPGAPLMRSESINADPDGIPLEYGITYFVGERVTLTLDHS